MHTKFDIYVFIITEMHTKFDIYVFIITEMCRAEMCRAH